MDLAQPVMWPNPLIMLAETAPTIDVDQDWDQFDDGRTPDALTIIKFGMREVSSPPHPSDYNNCDPADENYPEDLGTPLQIPMWPMGIVTWGAVALISLAVSVLRLAVPIKRLGAGTRIA